MVSSCTICHATDDRITFDDGTGDARCINHVYTARPRPEIHTEDALAEC